MSFMGGRILEQTRCFIDLAGDLNSQAQQNTMEKFYFCMRCFIGGLSPSVSPLGVLPRSVESVAKNRCG